MKKTCFLAAIVFVFLVQSGARSQSQDPPKFEIAGEFTTLDRDDFSGADFSGKRTNPGLGGRFTYNLNRVFSLEGAGYFFPKYCIDCVTSGRVTQVVGGVKVGKRFETWGIFAKARPGFAHFSDDFGGVVLCLNITCPFNTEPFEVKRNHFAMDIGGGVEFYPSRRIVTRFDAGDTIIRFRRRETDGLAFNPSTRRFEPFLFVEPARTSHNFQFFASLGFRF